jgi:hypothetical protein
MKIISFLYGIKWRYFHIKGVFGLTFSFGFCPPKSQKPTKGLDLQNSFLKKSTFS